MADVAQHYHHRRRRLEAIIRVIDIFVYGIAVAGGLYAVIATPISVVDVLEGAEWLVPVWAVLLLAGGLSGLIGRITRYWMIERPGTILTFFGAAIYAVMLGRYAFTTITASVALVFTMTAMLVFFRRWIELNIFASEPNDGSFSTRIANAIRRRTKNFPQRES